MITLEEYLLIHKLVGQLAYCAKEPIDFAFRFTARPDDREDCYRGMFEIKSRDKYREYFFKVEDAIKWLTDTVMILKRPPSKMMDSQTIRILT